MADPTTMMPNSDVPKLKSCPRGMTQSGNFSCVASEGTNVPTGYVTPFKTLNPNNPNDMCTNYNPTTKKNESNRSFNKGYDVWIYDSGWCRGNCPSGSTFIPPIIGPNGQVIQTGQCGKVSTADIPLKDRLQCKNGSVDPTTNLCPPTCNTGYILQG